jgi:hypothetical protein
MIDKSLVEGKGVVWTKGTGEGKVMIDKSLVEGKGVVWTKGLEEGKGIDRRKSCGREREDTVQKAGGGGGLDGLKYGGGGKDGRNYGGGGMD